MSRDRWSAAGLALLAIVYLVIARRYPLDTLATPGPGVMPLIAGVALFATAISIFIVAITARPARDAGGLFEERVAPTRPTESLMQRPMRWTARALCVALILYTVLLPWLGFAASSFALVVIAARLMGAPGWWRPIVLALGVAGVAHLLFARWLGVALP